jgi:hypothetical protein
MNHTIADIGMYAFVVGGLLVLTRPGSQGPGLLAAFGHAMTGVVQGSTGQKVTA